ncbi:hypothetical protein Pmani_038269 [Petrolisthes manimaculis]|uniref:Uncharacterized protein n=1 Tax=Petrolisthes manimaculis TaxID=1843537 RepID=A0AAE1NGJ3_9EUCA|nr:hypothetical protein Pmani_038269 [Petrolisthes manimaculis]
MFVKLSVFVVQGGSEQPRCLELQGGGGGSWACGWVASSRQVARFTLPVNDPKYPCGSPFAEEQSIRHAPSHVGGTERR